MIYLRTTGVDETFVEIPLVEVSKLREEEKYI